MRLACGCVRDAVPVAGGTDLLSEIRDGTSSPWTLIALDSVTDPELHGITVTDDGGIRIGALTVIADIAGHDGIRDCCTMLAQAAAAWPHRRSATWERWAGT